jgi:hypothetical protein
MGCLRRAKGCLSNVCGPGWTSTDAAIGRVGGWGWVGFVVGSLDENERKDRSLKKRSWGPKKQDWMFPG